jgi:hypothetical protein
MTNPQLTATNHTLPFDKLSPHDFERLCLWLVNVEGYQRAEHYGQGGNDQGRDIVAFHRTDGEERRWYFQCKRYKELGASLLKAEVDKLAKLPTAEQPHGIHFVTNANISAQSRLAVEQHCQAKGYACRFWAHTELDERVKQHEAIVREFFKMPDTTPYSAPRVEVKGDRNIIVMGNADGLTALTGDGNAISQSSVKITLSRITLVVVLLAVSAWLYSSTRPKPDPVTLPPVMKVLVNDAQGRPVADAVVELDALPGQQFITKSDGAVSIENIPRKVGDLIGFKVSKGEAKADGNLTFPNPNADVITLR